MVEVMILKDWDAVTDSMAAELALIIGTDHVAFNGEQTSRRVQSRLSSIRSHV